MKKKVSTLSNEPSHPLDEFTIQSLAYNTFQLYDEYITAGFNQEQAFELTKLVVSSICSFNVKK
jgi:hypothetical protein